MHQSRALLLRRYRLSETSLIIVWLTEEHGKVKTTAQGALKQGSAFTGRLELFSEAEIYFSLNKKSDLHFLKEVVPMLLPQRLNTSYQTLLCASYFAELCDLFTETLHPVPEIFGLLRRAFHFLSRESPSHRVLEHFEITLAKALGIYDPRIPVEHSLRVVVSHLPPNRKTLLSCFTDKNVKSVIAHPLLAKSKSSC